MVNSYRWWLVKWDTTLCGCMRTSLDKRLIGRRDQRDHRVARVEQDRDAADAGDVERRFHQLGAGLRSLGRAGIDIVDRDVGHPAFLELLEFRRADVEEAA